VASPAGEQAIAEAIGLGRAVIKFVSKNDAGVTGSHQVGFLLPKACWELFTRHAPVKGVNAEDDVTVTWQNGLVTHSRVKWYGLAKSEYRLTNELSGDFPYRTADNVGDLLVIVPLSLDEFHAYVLNPEEDLDDIEAALGVDLASKRWTCYVRGATPPQPLPESIEECIDRLFREYAAAVPRFPRGDEITAETWRVLAHCDSAFGRQSADQKIVRGMAAEFALFKMIERRFVWADIDRVFASVDDFVATANKVLNSRKSRAGRSLENHFGMVLREKSIPYDTRPRGAEDLPDVLIPSVADYNNPEFSTDKLFAVPVKTTLKDRWGQVLKEAPRLDKRYLMTVQPGVSVAQLNRMAKQGITLIVPKEIQGEYPDSDIEILSIEEFVALVRERLGSS
jgi:type II restriction enzyme